MLWGVYSLKVDYNKSRLSVIASKARQSSSDGGTGLPRFARNDDLHCSHRKPSRNAAAFNSSSRAGKDALTAAM